jgi:hypothetical protein
MAEQQKVGRAQSQSQLKHQQGQYREYNPNGIHEQYKSIVMAAKIA